MKVGQLVMSPPHVRIRRLLCHGAAMPFPFAVIQMVVVTHCLAPGSYKRQLLWGLSGAQRLW